MTSFGWFAEEAAKHGRIMCCICFEGVPVEQAWRDPDGQAWDMCQTCGDSEHRVDVAPGDQQA